MQIRVVKPSDKQSVLEFCKNTFSLGDYIDDVWDSWILDKNLFVIEEDDIIIGICHPTFSTNRQVWIEGVRIRPNYRKQGYGHKIILHCESLAQKNHCKISRMIIESENIDSIKLVEPMGYYIEEKWRLYNLMPKKEISTVTAAHDIKQVTNLVSSNTYADSWKWLPLEKSDIEELINKKRILVSTKNSHVSAIGIWNKSENFTNVLQIGMINGTQNAMKDILRFVQNMAYEFGCHRIQVFCQEKIPLEMESLNKRSLFYLMRKNL